MAIIPQRPAHASRESIMSVTKDIIRKQNLKTPCDTCRNFSRCSVIGSATFTLMGPHCTRNCKFCSVRHNKKPGKPDAEEPKKLAMTVKTLGLKHVVLTSVCRDDLKDLGASHFAKCIRSVRMLNPNTIIEVFIPDFACNGEYIRKVMEAGPDIVGHSIETVKRLQSIVRDRKAGYRQSLNTLKTMRKISKKIIIKSSLMLGFREQRFEVIAALRHMKRAGVDIITIGQYLRPSKNQLRVLEYVPRDTFQFYEREAYQLGYKHVIAKPLANHSYPSREMLMLMNSK